MLFYSNQVSEKIQQLLHVKSEDLRLYDLTADEDFPKPLEDETQTLQEIGFNKTSKVAPKEGFKLLIESMCQILGVGQILVNGHHDYKLGLYILHASCKCSK